MGQIPQWLRDDVNFVDIPKSKAEPENEDEPEIISDEEGGDGEKEPEDEKEGLELDDGRRSIGRRNEKDVSLKFHHHSQFFEEYTMPTFNSFAIESQIGRVEDVAEHL